MTIVGGLDIHRKQITFDYVDTVTDRVQRGRIIPADREHLAGWLAQRFRAGRMWSSPWRVALGGGTWPGNWLRPG